jgi:alkyldihydroxyacetonephosphate synthase
MRKLSTLPISWPHAFSEAIGNLSRDSHVLASYSQDLWPRKLLELREGGPKSEFTVDWVVWPSTPEELQTLVKWAPLANVSLYPYGAGSGVCGATIPGDQDTRIRVLVDLKRMRKIRWLDETSQVVCAEAGWIGENLERELNQRGYTLGHFPSSIYCSSLGGYLATRSAGQLSTKYGKIEDLVLSLECVTPDGNILESGRAPRSAMGPDWTQLLLGSEGTLVFFTAAQLQIQRLPKSRVFQGFEAKDVATALHYARSLVQGGLRPAAIRIYDPLETNLALNRAALTAAGFESGAAVIVVYEGPEKLTEVEASTGLELAKERSLRFLGESLGRHWWDHRYDVSYKQQLIVSHDHLILDTFEVAATWKDIETVYQSVKAAKVGPGLVLAHFSHFYPTGANIYFTLVAHTGFLKSAPERYDAIWEAVMAEALRAGATLSHHHGSGLLKNEWIRKEKQGWIPIFEKVKYAFDPENRFNPGKMGL